MNLLFVDTAGWLAAADAADPASAAACEARDGWLRRGGILVTSNTVCDETLTLLRVRLGAGAAEAWWRQVEASQRLRTERVDSRREDRARDLFFRSSDKEFSFADRTSFVIMREMAIGVALTLDRHFLQMGFRVLPGVE